VGDEEDDTVGLVGRNGIARSRTPCCPPRWASWAGVAHEAGLGGITLVTIFIHSSLRRTSHLLIAIWFTLSFGWYGLILWIPELFEKQNFSLDVYEDAFFVPAANLPGNIAAALLMDRVGRKNLLGGSMLVACGMALVFALSKTATLTVIAACLLNAVSIGAWNALDCLSTESFPTSLRNGAMGVLAACGRLGSIAGQFVFAALIDDVPLLLSLAAAILFLGAIAGFLFPRESAGAQLLEDIEDIEDEQEQQGTH
jgi:MFS family permease